MKDQTVFDQQEFDKCAHGELYNATFSGRDEMVTAALMLCQEYNQTPANDKTKRMELLHRLFGKVGKNPDVEPNVFCGFGFNIEIGDNFYANNGCNFVDPAKITFGDNVFIGPDCGFYTAVHPIDYHLRNQCYEWALPIRIGDNVWFGGGCRVLPGVTVGSNVVVGAGSIVTHSLPDNCVAVGNPCRVIRYINENGVEVPPSYKERNRHLDYGKKVWIFPDGDMPPRGSEEPFGHEALTITNTTDTDSVVDVTVLFTNREPDHFTLRVGARRVSCFRLDYPVGDENYLIPREQYSLILESNVPIVSVLGRLDRRKDFAYYEMDGFYE